MGVLVVDLVGKRFGRVVVLKQATSYCGYAMWEAVCDCGKKFTTRGGSLRAGDVKSCGCLRLEILTNRPCFNLLGQRFGRLRVVERVKNPHKNGAAWRCVCDCGNETVVSGANLRHRTRSCGCLAREQLIAKLSLPKGQAANNFLLDKYKRSAALRHLVWGLTDREFFTLIQRPCHYCGQPPSRPLPKLLRNRPTNAGFAYNGVDRKNNDDGYAIENTVPCCTACNRFKRAMSYEQFIAYLDRVETFRHTQKSAMGAA